MFLFLLYSFRNMPKLKRKSIGRPKRRTKANLAKRQADSQCAEIEPPQLRVAVHDHSYVDLSASTSTAVPSSVSLHNSPPVPQLNFLPSSPQNLQSTSPENSPSTSQDNSPPPSPHVRRDLFRDSCGFTGSFTSCNCIVHEHEEGMSDDNSLVDSDGYSDEADQFFVVYGAKSYEYAETDDINLLTFKCLRQEAITNVQHDQEVNDLGFSIIKATDKLHYVKMYEHESVTVSVCLTINNDLSPLITVHGKSLQNHEVYKDISTVHVLSDIYLLLNSISDYVICCGNSDSSFIEHYGFKGESFLEENSGAEYKSTIRSNCCTLLTKRTLRCENCMKTRRVLGNKELRLSKQNQTVTLSSSRPNCSMSRDQLLEKNKLLKNKVREVERQNKRLQAKALLAEEGFEAKLTEHDMEEIDTLVTECTPNLDTVFPDPDSFERIFWEEQIKYNQLRNKASMRWHPLIIKWSLLIKSKSSKAYETMRNQGFIHLPSERTLYDYSHYLPSKLGFVPEALDMLVTECQKKGMFKADWSSHVGILQDEIKVKDDLIYCPTTGQLIGYVNLDESSNHIMDIERGNQQASRDLATSALVIMIRGVTTNLKYPLAAFATRGLDSNQLYTILWQVIELLEDRGLKVLFITCDGASQNRKFFQTHRAEDNGEPVHSTPNPYADDNRQIYFISDVPHLLKTARNCFASSDSHRKSRLLWNNGQPILWTQLVNLFTHHIENKLYTKSHLTRAHIDLTSFSCMKVDLAAQIFSRRVGLHLKSVYGDEVRETVTFINHMNRFFDCLNVRNLYEGRDSGNRDLDVYTDVNDTRLEYLEETFLGYFEEWKESVKNRPGNFSRQEREKMLLSQQTLDGLKISVRSIVACVRYMLQQGAPFIMTEIFNQDVLEQHFGHYRHKGGACNNPTINDVRHTMNVLRTVGSQALAPLRGNTKRAKNAAELPADCHDIPRKKSRPSL